jgi:hypothetical protein
MTEFPAGRFAVQVDAINDRVVVTVIDNYGSAIRASVSPEVAAELGRKIQHEATAIIDSLGDHDGQP